MRIRRVTDPYRALVFALLCAACGTDTRGIHIATLPGTISSLVAGENKIYTRGYNEIYEIEPTGRSRALVTTPTESTVLAVASAELFFPLSVVTANGAIGAYDVSSGAQRTVVPPRSITAVVTELLADVDHVFWVEHALPGETTVHVVNADGTAPAVLANGFRILQDDHAVYWTSGDDIVRAEKANLSSRTSLATGPHGVTAVDRGKIYWSAGPAPTLLSMPADGSVIAPAVAAVLPTSSAGSDVTAIQFLAGTLYVEVMEHEHGDCPGTCFYTARVLEIDPGRQVEIARADHVSATPPFVAGAGGVFWAFSTSLYRIR